MSEHRWPPQPGDLVKVERSTYSPTEATHRLIGHICVVGHIYQSDPTDIGIIDPFDMTGRVFNLSDLSPADPPQTIEQFGRTYRLDEGGRTDAERLDWLGKHTMVSIRFTLRHRWSVFQNLDDLLGCGETPGAAIDAAMSATKEPTP